MFGMSLEDKVNFFRQLATLIHSGVSILGSFQALSGIDRPAIRNFVRKVTPQLQEGASLSQVFSQFPQYFDDMAIMMVKAGEMGGQLENRLKNIADYYEESYRESQKSLITMIYPAVIFHAGIFVPPLVILFTKGVAPYLRMTLIPLFTVYGAIFLCWFLYSIMRAVPGAREIIDAFLIYIPFIGGFLKAQSLYRFTLLSGDLMEAGIAIDTAVKASAGACGNSYMAMKLDRTVIPLQNGGGFSENIAKTGLFSHMLIQMLDTGEHSGELPQMLKKSAEMLNFQVQQTRKIIAVALPFVIFFAVAGYTGYMIITTFSKIYEPLMKING